uniref:Tyrosine-protein kinase n=1 Tax=Panagrolaimus sp. PS1159 TaxID=55785 RepID=A0AC35FMY5_9BILA
MVFGSKKKAAKSEQSKEAISKASKSSQSKEAVSKCSKSSQSKEPVTASSASQSKEAVSQCKTATSQSSKVKGENEDVMLKVMGKALTHNHWFHGLMPRDEIEDLLKNEGDFLMRKTEVDRKPRYAISVCRKGVIKHILLSYKNGLWSMRDCKKATLTDLIHAHVNDKIPVMSDGTLLINGVSRPEFYILHEHVDLKKKLGSGAFGEVFVGKWKKSDSETLDVAVKKLKGMMHKKERIEFVKEAKLMRRFDHQNIVKVYGVAPQVRTFNLKQ